MMFSKINSKKVLLTILLLLYVTVLSACGGSGGGGVSNEVIPGGGNKTIIPESVKYSKTGDTITVNYQTSVPVNKASVVSTDFAFDNAPLWSDFTDVKTTDGINHQAVIKTKGKKVNFMIFNSANDKYDNGGKGIKVE